MPSLAASVLAAALTVPFGATVPIHVAGPVAPLQAGAVVGDFLVAAAPRPAAAGGATVVLRPLALGTLAVPLPGAPDPDVILVRPTLGGHAAVAPIAVPPPPPLPWRTAVAAALAVATAALAAAIVRRRRRPDPAAAFATALRPLASLAGWSAAGAADRLASACREFLQHATGAPCVAMTTRELSRLLAARLDAATARPFGLALVLADDARYAGCAPPPEDAVLLVHDVLAAVPALAAARGAAR
ncbi:MAG: hypothetical protein EPN53_10705 [Acidobacteria bacterium]|nr:MAG: hypothetical protein EPN53_10705 [Acidobacteriota bacterium]